MSNLIYRSDNGKASLTVKNDNDHLDAVNIDLVGNRNIRGNCLNNTGLHLNSTGYGKLAKKIKNLSKNWWSVDSFSYRPNNYGKFSYKTTDFDKEKGRSNEHNSSQSARSKESSNDLSALHRVMLNNAGRLIIGHININSLRNKFEMLR